MGTSVLYRALSAYASDPVLRKLAGLIYADEVRHYKHFYHHFLLYQQVEHRSRMHLARTLARRLLATQGEDGRCAYRHIWDLAPGAQARSFEVDYHAFARDLMVLLRRYAPAEMLVRMALKPLALPPSVVTAAVRLSGPLYSLWLSAGAKAPDEGGLAARNADHAL